MAPWGFVAAAYGTVLALTALWRHMPRRAVVLTAAVAYVLVAVAAASAVPSAPSVPSTPSILSLSLIAPGALLLTGYWLSGFFFHTPQPWLERALLDWDHRIFRTPAFERSLRRAPRWILEVLEGTYAADYVVIGGGAIAAAFAGPAPLSYYWTVVLASELLCYMTLPWLRSRPPRVLEPPGALAVRAPVLRRLNVAVLDTASVQANTIPSGHVAGAVAAAFGLWPVSAVAGALLLGVAVLIGVAAVAGRYHYGVDCVSGAVLAGVVSLVAGGGSLM